MGGKSAEFPFDEPVERVWNAAMRAVSNLGYNVVHSDGSARVLSFNTGRSMSSWAGQDLTMTLIPDGSDSTLMAIGGSLGKGGNPFGGGQVFAWGEKDRLITRFIESVIEALPTVPDTASGGATPASGPVVSIADELGKLASLRDSGVLTEDEFQTQKRRLLG